MAKMARMSDTQTRIVAIINAKIAGSISATESFSALGLDSIGMAEILSELENTFEVRMDERVLETDNAVELAEYIDGLLAKHAAEPEPNSGSGRTGEARDHAV